MTTQSASKESRIAGYDHDDPSLRTGEGGLTIWDLQKMAQEKRFNELDNLFDNGLTMNALPNPDKLSNWYFLDFNEGALREQRESHSDGSKEEMLDPIPHVDN